MNGSNDASESPLSPAEFQQLVITALRANYPERTFVAESDPLQIQFGEGHVFGLSNLRRLTDQGTATREEITRCALEAFERVLAGSSEEAQQTPPWEQARSMLRLQIIPRSFLSYMVPPPLCRPLNGDVCTSVVIDRPYSYVYLNQPMLDEWQVSFEEAYELAARNLEEASQGMAMQGTQGDDRAVFIGVHDGYDAARILLPALRAHLVPHLGSPFFAAIPNRDFLVCWSSSCSREFQTTVREHVERDFHSQPYPLTPSVLVATVEEIRPASE